MPKLTIHFKHGAEIEKAKNGVRKVIDDFQKKQGSLIKEIRWSSDGCNADALGTGFKGNFSINEEEIKIDLDLSFIAMPFKAKIISTMEAKLKREFPDGKMKI